jgi:hypothetical protein
MGSGTFETVRKPSIALLIEEGVSSYDAGEIWHLLDNRFDMDVTLIPIRIFNKIPLDRYNTIILADGNYNSIAEITAKRLEEWVNQGGTIVAVEGAMTWLKLHNLIAIETVSPIKDEKSPKSYADAEAFSGAQQMGGSIFAARLDLTNPIGFGYKNTTLPVFVQSATYYTPPANPFAYPLQFTKNPLISGYSSSENLKRISESAGIIIAKKGKGRIVAFAFNPNFRAFWYRLTNCS